MFEVIFPLFGGTFHLILGIYLRGMFTGVLILGLVFITFRKFSTMYVRACESFTALNEQYCHIIQVSTHVQVDRSKSGCHDVCINQSIEDLCITHVMNAGRPTHHQPTLPGKLRNGQSPHNQYRISAICNPGNGNKTLEHNDSYIVMSFILWRKQLRIA